ncbi:MAG: VWA domain-containing protein [Deltaproteobacteria bacterium]|nr:VWA domain-containing protein [Deltaproteobacteria bacterium]
MRLESPFLLLALIPVGAAAWFALRRLARRPPALRFPTLARVRAARPPLLGRLWWVPLSLEILGAVAAVVALARPQAESTEELAGEGSDFVIALDMSGSMNAVDMLPEAILDHHARGREPPNRFETARETIASFIRSRDHDRISLVIFGGKAWVKFPLTLDKDAMTRILSGLVLDDGYRIPGTEGCTNGCTVEGERTAIGDALGRAYKRLEGSDSKSRNVILITDGDNNAGKAAPEEVARFIGEQAPDRPVRVYTFLVGTGDHTWVQARNPFTGRPVTTADGRRVYERPKDKFPVNPALLKEIARVTGGSYHEAATEEDFRREFEDLEKTRFAAPALREWREAWMPPLALAAVLLLVGHGLGLTVFRRWP